jgi:type I restriction enzyme S subunit
MDIGIVSPVYLVWKFKNNVIPSFMDYLLRTPLLLNSYLSRASGVVNRRRSVSKTDFLSISIPLPPYLEQQKIAKILDAIQNAIQQQDKIIETTKKLKKSLMQKLFTEGLYGEELKEIKIGLIPKNWKVVRLGDDDILLKTQYGLSVRGKKTGKYPILRMNNLVNGYINTTDLQFIDLDDITFGKFKLEIGDILFNRTNSIDLVGKTSIFTLDGNYVFASYLIRLKTNQTLLDAYFLNYFFNWEVTQSRLKGLASRGVSQANISATRLKTMAVPLPPLPEQQQIAEILMKVDKKIEIEGRRKATLKELFKTMLHKLMTGQIRLKDVEI